MTVLNKPMHLFSVTDERGPCARHTGVWLPAPHPPDWAGAAGRAVQVRGGGCVELKLSLLRVGIREYVLGIVSYSVAQGYAWLGVRGRWNYRQSRDDRRGTRERA